MRARRLDDGVQAVIKYLDLAFQQAQDDMLGSTGEGLETKRVEAVVLRDLRVKFNIPNFAETQAIYRQSVNKE